MILAGDIGGTKCNLAIFRETAGTTAVDLSAAVMLPATSPDLKIWSRTSAGTPPRASQRSGHPISAAGFGVAGAVVEGRLHANNLPWDLNLSELAHSLDLEQESIVLLNDVVATAWSLDKLPAKDLAVVNQGVSCSRTRPAP